MPDDNWMNAPPQTGDAPVATEPPEREPVTAGTPHTPDDDVVLDGSNGTVRTLVDGADALVDTRPAPEPIMDVDTLEDLVHALYLQDAVVTLLEDEKKHVASQLKAAIDEREEIISRMKHLDAVGSQLPLVAQATADEAEDAGV